MQKDDITRLVNDFLVGDQSNVIAEDLALKPELAGLRIFDEAIVRVGAVDDPYFDTLCEPGVIGPHFKKPSEWLEGAVSVVSIFLPFRQPIRDDNKGDMDWPSPAWLHGRIEGQDMIVRLTLHLLEAVRSAGYEAMAPLLDERFFSRMAFTGDSDAGPCFTSNWSERHVAFVCGVGTFGLSKGLITEKGVAGRLMSLITNLHLPRDGRYYSEIYGNCSMCGACAKNCPAGAISIETGKDHVKCSEFLGRTKARYAPRYGCGKCQVKVPCESRACAGAV